MAAGDRARHSVARQITDGAIFGAERLRVLVDSVSAMIAYVDTQERIQFCNRAYLRAFGLGEPDAMGRTIREILGDAAYMSLKAHIADALSGQMVYYERTQTWASGESSEVAVTYVPHFGEDGRVLGFHTVLVDITARKITEQALRKSEAALRTIADNLPALVAYVGADEIYQFANRTYEDWFGLRPDQVVGRSVREVLGDDYEKAKPYIDEALAGRRTEYERDLFLNSRHRHLHNVYVPSLDADGRAVGFSVLATDVSERKALENDLAHRASHDPLTGLPNRALFEDRLEQALERSKRHQTVLAVMYLDIDRFKNINDKLGHQMGDEVLKAFAGRLVECVRTTDTVARLGGDEFVIILDELDAANDAERVAHKVLTALQPAFRPDGATVSATASIGLAICEPGQYEAGALLARADAALYRAKAEGRNRWQAAA